MFAWMRPGCSKFPAAHQRGLQAVERPGVGVEEAEGVEVRAADGPRLDQRVDLRLGQPQRGGAGVADLLAAIDHRPLVQAVAGEYRRAVAGGGEQFAQAVKARLLLVGEQVGIGKIARPSCR